MLALLFDLTITIDPYVPYLWWRHLLKRNIILAVNLC
jgi:hypothetical protein